VKGLNLLTPEWPRAQLEQETNRIFDICDGCRRCFNLCPSFNTLLNRIDEHESDLTKLTPAVYEQVEKECYYCKLCYNHCPYTPPHDYQIDFPRLMAAWKKQRIAEQGARWQDRLLMNTDLLGSMGSLTAPLSNWALNLSWVRNILEGLVGLHRDRKVIPFQRENLTKWWAHRQSKKEQPGTSGKVVLFPSCMVNYQATDIGKATIQVLEHNNIEVVMPTGQQCCGMPSFDLGDTQAMIQTAKHHASLFRPYIDQGFNVIIPTPSCSLMFKREYPYLCEDENVKLLATRTYDLCEYLMLRKKEGKLSLTFPQNPGRIAYQIPCHLRDQNIGFKSKELMELTGAKVHLIEKCSGHDGTWGAKVEFFDLSMKIAKKAVREIEQAPFDVAASDCPLSALQLDQARLGKDGTLSTLHPIQIVRDAYQLSL
jgi:Fe-S oxidoreductase